MKKFLCLILMSFMVFGVIGIAMATGEAPLPTVSGADVILPPQVAKAMGSVDKMLIANDDNHFQVDGTLYADPGLKPVLLADGSLQIPNGAIMDGFNIIILAQDGEYAKFGARWMPFHVLWNVDKYVIDPNQPDANPLAFIEGRELGYNFNFKHFRQ